MRLSLPCTLSFFLFSLLLFLSLPAAGSQTEENPGYQVLTAPELKELMEEESPLIIHSLSKIEYDIQHIKGSINIPVVDMETTDKLPADKSHPIVFYCMGTR